MTRLIVGCGYLGQRVASRWRDAGAEVWATARSDDSAAQLEAAGLHALVADVTEPKTLVRLPPAQTVLFAVAYDPQGGHTREAVLVDGLRRVLDALPAAPEKILYVSSTGVYGGSDGDWVAEDAPCRPVREIGKTVLAAENVLRRHPLGERAAILRLAGIYGTGRIPKLADLLAGRPLVVPEQGWLNLIHVDDAVAAIVAAERRALVPRIYNISDGHPAGRRDFYRRLAELLGRNPPEFLEPTPEQRAASRFASDKRVCNARMLAELSVVLTHPSYREGLAALVNAR